jgi:hypothetical protein
VAAAAVQQAAAAATASGQLGVLARHQLRRQQQEVGQPV